MWAESLSNLIAAGGAGTRALGFYLCLQDTLSYLKRAWSYINHEFTLGNFKISLSSIMIGVAALLIAMIISRSLRSFLQRRIEGHKRIDPGLQYTLLRLIH